MDMPSFLLFFYPSGFPRFQGKNTQVYDMLISQRMFLAKSLFCMTLEIRSTENIMQCARSQFTHNSLYMQPMSLSLMFIN